MNGQPAVCSLFVEQAAPFTFEPHWVDKEFGDRLWSTAPITVMMAIHGSARMAMDSLENVWFRMGRHSTEIDRDHVTHKLAQRIDNHMNVATMLVHGKERDRVVEFLKRMTVRERYSILQPSDTACALIDTGIRAEEVLSFYPDQVKEAAAKVLGGRMLQRAICREHSLQWDSEQAISMLHKMNQKDVLAVLDGDNIFALMDCRQPIEDIISLYPEGMRRGIVRCLADTLQGKIRARAHSMQDTMRCIQLERFHAVLAANYYGAAYPRGISADQYYDWLEKHGYLQDGKFTPNRDAAPR